jgi:hypothetical protein
MRTISVIIFATILLLGLIACNVPHVELSKPKQIDPETFYQSADIGKRHLLKSKSGAIIISDKDVIVLDSANNVIVHEEDPAGVTYKIIAELNQNWIEQDSIKQSRGQNERIQTSLRPPSKIKNPCGGQKTWGLFTGREDPVVTFTNDSFPTDTGDIIIGTPYLTKTEGILVPKYKAGDTFRSKNGVTVYIVCSKRYDSFGHEYGRNCNGLWDESVSDWVYNTLSVTKNGSHIYGSMPEKAIDKIKRLESVSVIGNSKRNK